MALPPCRRVGNAPGDYFIGGGSVAVNVAGNKKPLEFQRFFKGVSAFRSVFYACRAAAKCSAATSTTTMPMLSTP